MEDNTTVEEKKKLIRQYRKFGDIPVWCRKLGITDSTFWRAYNRTDGVYTQNESDVLLLAYMTALERKAKRETMRLDEYKLGADVKREVNV